MLRSIERLKSEKVELFMGNHLVDNKTEEKLSALQNATENPFVKNSQNEWAEFLSSRMAKTKQLIEEDL